MGNLLASQTKAALRVAAMAGLILGAIGVRSAQAVVDVVRTYDENVVQLNFVDVSATPMTVGQMTALVAAAYDAGRGGVINFDNGSFEDTRTIVARFAGGSRSLRMVNLERDWSIGVLGTSPTSGALSGGNVAFNGAPAPFPNAFLNDIAFDYVTDTATNTVLPDRVTAFGFSVLDATANSSANDMSFEAFFSNGTSQALNHQVPFGFNSFDTFFGFAAPVGSHITHIRFSANNNTATDDWAFITEVPEPGAGAIAVAGIGLLTARRSRRSNSGGI